MKTTQCGRRSVLPIKPSIEGSKCHRLSFPAIRYGKRKYIVGTGHEISRLVVLCDAWVVEELHRHIPLGRQLRQRWTHLHQSSHHRLKCSGGRLNADKWTTRAVELKPGHISMLSICNTVLECERVCLENFGTIVRVAMNVDMQCMEMASLDGDKSTLFLFTVSLGSVLPPVTLASQSRNLSARLLRPRRRMRMTVCGGCASLVFLVSLPAA